MDLNKFETELTKEQKQVCRDVVREINNFGLSSRHKLYIIYLLALEIENKDVMTNLVNVVKDARKDLGTKTGNLELPETVTKKKLITT